MVFVRCHLHVFLFQFDGLSILIFHEQSQDFVLYYKHTFKYWICNYIQPVPIATYVVSSNPVHGEVYSIQHYVIKFVNTLRQVGGFLQVLLFPPPIKLTATTLLKYC
jgi:hypothetical protein